jgi:anti-anti-sigma factor
MTEQARFQQRESDGVQIVEASGEIDISNYEQLRQLLKDVSAKSTGAVVVALNDVTYLDSHTLQVLTDASRRLATNRRRLLVVSPHNTAAGRILRIANLNLAVPIFESMEEALISLRP